MITGIVVALPEELVTLTAKRIEKDHCVFIGDKILVACAGMGSVNAASAAEMLIAKGATQLISWGCAAGLDPLMKPGDLTLAECLLAFDNEQIAINRKWFSHTKNLLKKTFEENSSERKKAFVHTGLLAESAAMVTTSHAKRQLHSFTKALALDMESSAVARVAQKHAVPFLAIRSIVDPASIGIPDAVAYATNTDGEVAIGKLLRYLFLHPMQLPQLIKLGIYFGKAKQTLKKVAAQLEAIAEFDISHANG